VKRCFVFLNLRKTAYGIVETVIRIVIIDLTHLTYHYLALSWFAIETMVEVLFHTDALTWFEDDFPTRFHRMFNAVYAIMDRRIGKALVLVCIIELDDEVSATSVDDVLHLAPMEMHRCFLQFFDYHNLLGIRFLVDTILAIPDGEEEEATTLEIA
jgi:hypothetical protein